MSGAQSNNHLEPFGTCCSFVEPSFIFPWPLGRGQSSSTCGVSQSWWWSDNNGPYPINPRWLDHNWARSLLKVLPKSEGQHLLFGIDQWGTRRIYVITDQNQELDHLDTACYGTNTLCPIKKSWNVTHLYKYLFLQSLDFRCISVQHEEPLPFGLLFTPLGF